MVSHSLAHCQASQTYLKHRCRLIEVARLRGCDHQQAEDIVQDIFMKLFRLGQLDKLHELTERKQAAVLRYRLKSALLNQWRNSQRQRRAARLTVSISELEECEWHPVIQKTPSSELDRLWAIQMVSEALAKLGAEYGSHWHMVETVLYNEGNAGTLSVAHRVALCRARKRLRILVSPREVREALLATT